MQNNLYPATYLSPYNNNSPYNNLTTIPTAPVVNTPTPNVGYSNSLHNDIIWVQGLEGAKAYPVAAGNSVLLMDAEKSIFYIKSTDQSGVPMPLRIFDYTERKTDTSKNTKEEKAAPTKDYVTRDEFEAAISELKSKKKGKKDE